MYYSNAAQQGLHVPAFDFDGCGVGFVCHLSGTPSHAIVKQGLQVLSNLGHRGARGCDERTGDGAGILVQLPHAFLRQAAQASGVDLPEAGMYGAGLVFLPRGDEARAACMERVEATVVEEGQIMLGWREVPTDNRALGVTARQNEPVICQVFIGTGSGVHNAEAFERKLYVIRKLASRRIRQERIGHDTFYIPSLSARTMVYKGMLTADQVARYYPDLSDPAFESALVMCHSRFSTNTLPQWSLAHPFRFLCHNGEINTLRGNVNGMNTRQALFVSERFGDDLAKVLPVLREGGSDSAVLDNALELLYFTGRSLPHAIMMLVPEAWEHHAEMDDARRAFYEYHACIMEPWDGPATLPFTDGRYVGAVLDRNGLRPSRYTVTTDGLVVLASEAGVLDIDPAEVETKGRLQPGRMFLADLHEHRIVSDEEIKQQIATRKPYRKWLDDHLITLDDLPDLAAASGGSLNGAARRPIAHNSRAPELNRPAWPGPARRPDLVTRANGWGDAGRLSGTIRIEEGVCISERLARRDPAPAPPDEAADLRTRQRLFGYTLEDLRLMLAPMGQTGDDPTGSMGDDTPLAVLSDQPRLLYDYFKQLFAQVTNPPLDSIREELVTSLYSYLGAERDLFQETPEHCHLLRLEQPILTDTDLQRIRAAQDDRLHVRTLPTCYDVDAGGEGLRAALEGLCAVAAAAVEAGCTVLVLSDRAAGCTQAPIPALLATGAIHHHLIREGKRTRCSIVVESGEPREVHHVCLLVGYGAEAVNPYLAFETVRDLVQRGDIEGARPDAAVQAYIKAAGKGILKVMSKMGISTLQSYHGAQIFEAVGLSDDVVRPYFTGTPSRLGGVGLDVLAEEVRQRHAHAYPQAVIDAALDLNTGGRFHWRRGGEHHVFNPHTVAKLQHAAQHKAADSYDDYARRVNEQNRRLGTLRGLLDFDAEGSGSVPLDEVEPWTDIVTRFKTGAMSYGSISQETHEALAEAMNRLGGKSNTGEGGEHPERYDDASPYRSRIKQVASGRFGVTAGYLASADEIQIKMAQGAKPGEGGQLPGRKVYPWIAEVRHSTPYVGLISPPPHHDIYSIEDLAQLIFDLKNANPIARVSVKLVSEVGVGTVAAGVAKGKADTVLISGHDGGTGASPRTSLAHAGLPWELGLAETQQMLVRQGLRSRIRIECDGQLKTGRDVAIAALLGAEEFGFATAPLVAMGCIMMRKCHLNTCPVGIATQDPELRKKFMGTPEHVINYLHFVAEELRHIMARLGFRTVDEMVGRVDRLRLRANVDHWKAHALDLAPILEQPKVPGYLQSMLTSEQKHGLDDVLDRTLIRQAQPALEHGTPVEIDVAIANTHRTLGTMLSYEVARRYGEDGLPDGTITLNAQGAAGQGFCAFATRGITAQVRGEANDYFGKGLSGARLIIQPPDEARYAAEDNIIVGNVALYGATSGEAYIRGQAGERFAVRNSGARAVVEGVGDHGCEYMTGGRVVVLGPTGRNFAAGMSGGIAYVWDPSGTFAARCNREMVELEPVAAGAERNELRALIEQHHACTGSTVANAILTDWDSEVVRFVKVMPTEYRRALEQLAGEGRAEDMPDAALASVERSTGDS